MLTVGCRRPWRDAFAAAEYPGVSCPNGRVRFGSKPVRFRTSRCFPGPPPKRTSAHQWVRAGPASVPRFQVRKRGWRGL